MRSKWKPGGARRAPPGFRFERTLVLGHAHCARFASVSDRRKDGCKNQFNDKARDDIHDNFCDQTPKHPHPPLHVHDKNSDCSLKPTSQASVELAT